MAENHKSLNIDGQDYRILAVIIREPGRIIYQAEADQCGSCFISRFKITTSLPVQIIANALPLALRIDHPHVQKLIAAEVHNGQPGEVRLVVREAPDHSTIISKIQQGDQPESLVRSALAQVTKGIAARAAVKIGLGCLAAEHILIDDHNIRIINPLVSWLTREARRPSNQAKKTPEINSQQPTDLINDCYAACAIAFAMLTGKSYTNSASLTNVRHQRADCSPAFAALLQRGLHPDRQQRFPSPGDLMQAIEALPPTEESKLDDLSFTAALDYLGPDPEPVTASKTGQSSDRRRLQSTNRRSHSRRSGSKHVRQSEDSQRIPNNSNNKYLILGLIGIAVVGVVIAATIILSQPKPQPAPSTSPKPQIVATPDTPTFKSQPSSIPQTGGPAFLQPLEEPIRDLPQLKNQPITESPTNSANTQQSHHSFPAPASPHEGKEGIILLPHMGKVDSTNTTWRLINHQEATSGTVWMSINQPFSNWDRDNVRQALPNLQAITYTFHAEVGVPYHYWIRGYCEARDSRNHHDALFILFESDVTWSKPPALRGMPPLWPGLASLDGWGHQPGWKWVSARVPADDPLSSTDSKQRTITFNTPGPHQLKIFLDEGPIAFEAIWFSRTQDTRPPSHFTLPWNDD